MERTAPEIVTQYREHGRAIQVWLIPPKGPESDALVGLDGLVRPYLVRHVGGNSGMLNANGEYALPWVGTDHQPLPASRTRPGPFDWPNFAYFDKETPLRSAGWVFCRYMPVNVRGKVHWPEVLIKDTRALKPAPPVTPELGGPVYKTSFRERIKHLFRTRPVFTRK